MYLIIHVYFSWAISKEVTKIREHIILIKQEVFLNNFYEELKKHLHVDNVAEKIIVDCYLLF